MKKFCKILLIVIACLAALFLAALMIELDTPLPRPVDYDDPESLIDLAERTEQYLIRTLPNKSPERQAALKGLEDIALLDVSDEEKARLIHERFPEESFWTDDMRGVLKSAEAGDPEAQFELGCLYLPGETPFWDDGIDLTRGKCIVKSVTLAVKWFRRAALQGHVKAQNRLPYFGWFHHPARKNRDIPVGKERELAEKEQKEWIRKAVENKDPLILLRSGDLFFFSGDDFFRKENRDRRAAEGLALTREAAGQGQVKAMLCLTELKSVPDEEKIEWYRRAAELGSVEAMITYADVCEHGGLVRAKNQTGAGTKAEVEAAAAGNEGLAEARMWRRKAFDAAMKRLDEGETTELYRWLKGVNLEEEYLDGESKAAFAARTMERLYELLERNPKDNTIFGSILRLIQILLDEGVDVEKARSTRALADAGNYTLQEHLASYLIYGNTSIIPEDKPEGIRLLRKLAGFGSPSARRDLGRCYLEGDGVPKDRGEGLEWLRKAAEQGDDNAMYKLSQCFKYRPWNWPEGIKWAMMFRMSMSATPYGPFPFLDFCLDELKDLWNSIRR